MPPLALRRPAITSGKPLKHEDRDLRLEHQAGPSASAPARPTEVQGLPLRSKCQADSTGSINSRRASDIQWQPAAQRLWPAAGEFLQRDAGEVGAGSGDPCLSYPGRFGLGPAGRITPRSHKCQGVRVLAPLGQPGANVVGEGACCSLIERLSARRRDAARLEDGGRRQLRLCRDPHPPAREAGSFTRE
jgi:hypothetical protein